MTNCDTLEQFLLCNNIDNETWTRANIDWDILSAIAEDHELQSPKLEESATFFARLIQKYRAVHSVRWRVKDTAHLLAKIVRKRAEENPKYLNVDATNYFEIVTDLVGIRVLHLFKDDCFQIHNDLLEQWEPVEPPVAYTRTGDRDELNTQFEAHGLEIKQHPAGYRSVHYVFTSQLLKRKTITEIQVRTIFEEGWSEIDHTVRYPNFSDSELVDYFLTIFNRLAGSADEMGGFVRRLADNLSHMEEEISTAQAANASILRDMEVAIGELEKAKEEGNSAKEHIRTLKVELEKLKAVEKTESNLDSPAFIRRAASLVDRQNAFLRQAKDDPYSKILRNANLSAVSEKSKAQINALSAAAKGLDFSKVSRTLETLDHDLNSAERNALLRMIGTKGGLKAAVDGMQKNGTIAAKPIRNKDKPDN